MKEVSVGFSKEYFKAYAGSGRSYDSVWREHSFADELVAQFKTPGAPRLKRICVLGVATGKVGLFLEKKLKAKVWGCELSSWAHAKIPHPLKRRVRRQDMCDYVAQLKRDKKNFDLIFSNSLIYLEQKQLGALLKSLAGIGRILHFNSSFEGKACPDPERKILKSYNWWNLQFRKAGFEALKGPRGHRTYLWASKEFSDRK
jgi:hypothetical protein